MSMNFTTASVLRARKSLVLAIFLTAAALVANFFFSPTKAEAVTQTVTYSMNGDCSDYYDQEGEYAFFEEEEDWKCYVTVKVKPITPKRTIRLQYWDKKWKEENKSITSSKGSGNLYFDPYCSDGAYCDGTWKFRVYVDAASGQKATYSSSFEVSFYAIQTDEEDSYE